MFWFVSTVLAVNWDDQISIALKTKIESHLQTFISGPVEVEVEELGLKMKDPCPSVDRVDIDFPDREDFQGLISVKAHLFAEEKLCQSLRFQSRVKILVTLPVAKESIPALGDVSVVEAQVRYDLVQGTPVKMNSGPWVARTSLRKMEPITHERVKLKPLNLEGEQVVVLLKKKGLEIEMKGKLMSDAYKDSRVRVLVFATSTVLDGILVDKDKVEIRGERR